MTVVVFLIVVVATSNVRTMDGSHIKAMFCKRAFCATVSLMWLYRAIPPQNRQVPHPPLSLGKSPSSLPIRVCEVWIRASCHQDLGDSW